MLNGGSMIWGFCVYFVYMIPLETDVLRNIVSKNGGIPLDPPLGLLVQDSLPAVSLCCVRHHCVVSDTLSAT